MRFPFFAPGHLNKKDFYLLLLLFIFSVGSYYNSIVHGIFISLDDHALIGALINNPPFDILDIFFNTGSQKYYRPFVELSYRLDHLLWFDQESGYHLTNIMLHFTTTVLVYVATLILFREDELNARPIAMLSAAFFAVNPLLSESVCWVSGRSDIIATSLTLASFIFYLKFKRGKRYSFLVLGGIFFIFAILTKEVALSLPVIILTLELFYGKYFFKEGRPDYIITYSILGGFSILLLLYFIFLRGGGIDTSQMNIGIGDRGTVVTSSLDNLKVFIASYGFYVKKLFFPYPLNFAIHKINLSLYSLLGVLVIAASIVWGLIRSNVYSLFLVWVMVAISPAVLAAVLMLPWTPWAERFLYLPMVGFSMFAGKFFISMKNRYGNIGILIIGTILLCLWAGTQQRIYVWSNELRLWEDAASKTDYAPVYRLYGTMLFNDGRHSEAIEQLEKGIKRGYTYKSYITLADMKRAMKDYDGYEKTMKEAIGKFPNDARLHKVFAEEYIRIAEDSEEEKEEIVLKAIREFENYLKLRSYDYQIHFKVAALYKHVNQDSKALPHLKWVTKLKPDSRQAKTARRVIQEMELREKLW